MPIDETQPISAPPSPFLKWTGLLVLSLALAIIVIDTTLLNVSLRTIIIDLHTDIQHLQWVISAYALILAALTITGGRLGDLFGRKKMFMLGAIIFAVGSLIASFSQNFWQMIIGEAVIEGIGAALMMPATASLLVSTFRGRERAIAFGVWGGVAAAASAVGPILGGYLTTHYSWRWGFRINVVVAALLLLGSLVIKESIDTEEKHQLDWIGVFLSAFGLTSIVFGIIEASSYGWWKAAQDFSINGFIVKSGYISIVPYSILIGFFFLFLFLLWELHVEKKGRTPLVSLHLFDNAQFSSGLTTSLIMSLGQSGIIFALPVFLQAVRGLDAFNTGLALLPLSISILVAAPLAGFMSRYITAKRLIQIGLFLNIAAVFAIRYAMKVDASSIDFAPGLILYGVGMGIVMSQISNITLSAVSVQQAGEASGLSNTFRQIGTSLGSAIIGSVVLSTLATNLAQGITNSTVIPAQAKTQIQEVVAKNSSAIEFGGGDTAKEESQMPPAIMQEISTISKQSMTDANRYGFLLTALFSFFAFVASFRLPNVKNLERDHSKPVAGH